MCVGHKKKSVVSCLVAQTSPIASSAFPLCFVNYSGIIMNVCRYYVNDSVSNKVTER